jgi:hypothetical protein
LITAGRPSERTKPRTSCPRATARARVAAKPVAAGHGRLRVVLRRHPRGAVPPFGYTTKPFSSEGADHERAAAATSGDPRRHQLGCSTQQSAASYATRVARVPPKSAPLLRLSPLRHVKIPGDRALAPTQLSARGGGGLRQNTLALEGKKRRCRRLLSPSCRPPFPLRLAETRSDGPKPVTLNDRAREEARIPSGLTRRREPSAACSPQTSAANQPWATSACSMIAKRLALQRSPVARAARSRRRCGFVTFFDRQIHRHRRTFSSGLLEPLQNPQPRRAEVAGRARGFRPRKLHQRSARAITGPNRPSTIVGIARE